MMPGKAFAAGYFRRLAPATAGAAALLVSVFALGIDPLVSAVVGLLIWAGAHLMATARPDGLRPSSGLSPEQTEHLRRARSLILRLRDLASAVPEPDIARTVDEIADEANALLASVLRAPDTYGATRRPLGTFLAQAVAIAERLERGQDSSTVGSAADRARISRARDSLERLRALFSACRTRAGQRARMDLDARIAVLEAEIGAENTRGS